MKWSDTIFRVKAVFLCILVFSAITIVIKRPVYPSLRFPQFPAREGMDSTIKVRLYSIASGKPVDLMSVIKPYDKQYYLFAMRALANPEQAPKMLVFLNGLYQETHNSDSLRVETESISIP